MIATFSRILLFFIIFAAPVQAIKLPPRPQGPVADYAHVLDSRTVRNITILNTELYNKTGFALVIATLPTIGDESVEEVAADLYKKWGIGKKGTDEGALVLLSMQPRKVRIEVGYGAEGYLNDAKAGRLLDTYAIPDFRNGDYGRGILRLCGATAQIVAGEKQVSLELPAGATPRQQYKSVSLSKAKMLFFLIVFVFLMSTRFGRSLLFWMLLSNMMGGGRRGSMGGFGGGFGGGGGGFGGFGGGMSGGGGASRGF